MVSTSLKANSSVAAVSTSDLFHVCWFGDGHGPDATERCGVTHGVATPCLGCGSEKAVPSREQARHGPIGDADLGIDVLDMVARRLS